MRNILAVAGTAAVLCLGVVGTDARAADIMYDGNFCQPASSGQGEVSHTLFGVMNGTATHNVWVQCPFNPPFFATIKEVYVQVYDRNPVENVECTLRGIDLAGNVLWSQWSSSSNSAGPGLQVLGFYPYASTHTMTMRCMIPYAWQGASHVLTYRAIHTP